MKDQLAKLREKRQRALEGGGPARIDAQHAKGKLTARERLAILLDEASFQELGALATHQSTDFGMAERRYPGDGVITGFGKIQGRRVAVYAQDFTVLGGSFSEVQSNKISRIQDLAIEAGIPLIGLNDSGGARVQEGIRSLAAYGEVFMRNVKASGVIPQISLIMGPCAGGAVYSPALTDITIMVDQTSNMFLTGPEIIKTVTGEEVSAEELGGAQVHNAASGVAQLIADDEQHALSLTKALLAYLPQNNAEDPPPLEPYDPADRMDEALNSLIPTDDRAAYDARQMLELIFDRGSLFELHQDWAPNALVGFARLDGMSVGFVANQPQVLSGCLDIDASDKIARHITLCDQFNIPLITFVDCPGYLPGVEQEHRGVIRHGAKIIYAYCQATVPKISIVTRKAMGGSYVALSSKQMNNDVAYAWPTAQIAVMGAEGAARLLHRRAIAAADDPAEEEARFVADYKERFFNPYEAADVGQIDEVIEPRETRPRLIRALEVLRTKVSVGVPKKHGLFPV
ncbi:acyl-CoA carboxylase subunit beta [Tessaracoccus caeni]|uniref:acyl-CoA carboxylase subunit beta n=1 Tax=Tessaracoccus caeni TaxID=3031239 RepID=UPI0023DA43E0|nr:acyl-CoA carboxylase subunit beta [Tessaracoccus caeni]MDF1487296.1 acyl-CoA carboxylase subunit beta [Tessaracoccus caeni]